MRKIRSPLFQNKGCVRDDMQLVEHISFGAYLFVHTDHAISGITANLSECDFPCTVLTALRSSNQPITTIVKKQNPL